MKSRQELIAKLGIHELNSMQIEVISAIENNPEVIVQSPTGTGKTVAFLLPIVEAINADLEELQALIVVPTRELAIQIEQVMRDMGSGIKCNAVYGGQSFNQDRLNLKHTPSLIVGTPGRVADHLRRNTFSTESTKLLVLDEFDKSLEIGFEGEMKEILAELQGVKKRVLTSATIGISIPDFLQLKNPITIKNEDTGRSSIEMNLLISPDKDKLNTLAESLSALANKRGIVFCNFKDSIQRISDYLFDHNVPHGCFYGGLDQHERELALIKFRNGTHRLILATDLAARGLDVPDIDFIIHYHLPLKEHEFVHRNGRTARMHKQGSVYVLLSQQENAPEYLPKLEIGQIENEPEQMDYWKTIKFSAGRRDKISKGDVAGLCYKKGGLSKDELGQIELKSDSAFVAVKAEKALDLIGKLNGERLKKSKLRISGC